MTNYPTRPPLTAAEELALAKKRRWLLWWLCSPATTTPTKNHAGGPTLAVEFVTRHVGRGRTAHNYRCVRRRVVMT